MEPDADNSQNYRYWILFLVPQIRFLDYQKVKDTERVKAREIFGTLKAPTEAAQSILAASANASTSYIAPLANGASKQPKVKLNEKEKARFHGFADGVNRKAKSFVPSRSLTVITGVGRHSAGQTGVLGPAVANTLEANGWRIERGERTRGYVSVTARGAF